MILFALMGFSQSGAMSTAAGGLAELKPRNSWRGIVPLQSSPDDVARVVGIEQDEQPSTAGPFKVEGGEVTFNFLTPSLAKIYRAPRSWHGRVFTIYFKPDTGFSRGDLKLGVEFKRCVEQLSPSQYYLVSDAGVAYRFPRGSDEADTVIYQPSKAAVRSLAVSTECVF
jgi:hypothetical protein